MPPSCTFSVSSLLLPLLSDRQRTASCLPPFTRAIPRPAATDDMPLPTSTPFFSDEMILTHLLASRNTVHARVAEIVQAVVGNKVRNPLAPPLSAEKQRPDPLCRTSSHSSSETVRATFLFFHFPFPFDYALLYFYLTYRRVSTSCPPTRIYPHYPVPSLFPLSTSSFIHPYILTHP
jgi:hypothetical protein